LKKNASFGLLSFPTAEKIKYKVAACGEGMRSVGLKLPLHYKRKNVPTRRASGAAEADYDFLFSQLKKVGVYQGEGEADKTMEVYTKSLNADGWRSLQQLKEFNASNDDLKEAGISDPAHRYAILQAAGLRVPKRERE